MRILGIDPGLNITGYGLIEVNPVRKCGEVNTAFIGGRKRSVISGLSNGVKNSRVVLIEAGVIKTLARQDLNSRLNKIYNGLASLIKEQKPDCMVLEKLYTHYRHPVTASLLGHARGVISLLASQLKLDFFEYPPKRIRQAILGSGNASKPQLQRMVENTFRLKPNTLSLDISDALGLALAHAQFLKVSPVRKCGDLNTTFIARRKRSVISGLSNGVRI